MKKFLIVSFVIIIAGATGYGLQRMLSSSPNQPRISAPTAAIDVINQPRPAFSLKDIDGELRDIKEWDDKVLLVNFWATWCPPCKKEIPAFMELQEKYTDHGFQIIGIAIDDEQAVRDFADTMGMNYPIMAAELAAMELAREYGNRVNALPYSAFVSREGKITHVRAGELSKQETEKIIKSLL